MLPGPPKKLPNWAQQVHLGAETANLERNLLPIWFILRSSWAHLRPNFAKNLDRTSQKSQEAPPDTSRPPRVAPEAWFLHSFGVESGPHFQLFLHSLLQFSISILLNIWFALYSDFRPFILINTHYTWQDPQQIPIARLKKMAEQQGWLDGSIKNKSASFYSNPAGFSMLMHRNNVRFCEAIKPTTGGRRQRRQPSDIYLTKTRIS